MNEKLTAQLSLELVDFGKLTPTDSVNSITEAYDRVVDIVQSLMLTNEDPDLHARAWSLLRDDTYKYLSQIQGGNTNALEELKNKMHQMGKLLLFW